VISHASLYAANLPRKPLPALPVLLGRGIKLPLVVGDVGRQLGTLPLKSLPLVDGCWHVRNDSAVRNGGLAKCPAIARRGGAALWRPPSRALPCTGGAGCDFSSYWGLLVAGCASAGGTAGVFDNIWYEHLGTGEVKECGGGVYPGVQIRRRACGKTLCGKTLIGVGYTEVEKCKAAAAGSACVTDDEIARAEAEEKRLKR
jgi:hypothetical protein